MAVVYTIIFLGVILLAIGFVTWYYGRVFSGELEECESRITALKPMTSQPYNIMVCPEAEYSINGRLVRGHYYTHVLESAANIKVGDTVRIQVNPRHPKVFRIEDIENSMPMKKTKSSAPYFAIVGAGLIAIGIIFAFYK
ncbi:MULTISPECIES: DUF3592 domain-containing protein [Ruminococcus]|uniref:DUF3592 domain-containing protein n=1 Tax=Ruminococcus flavefaciens TaxID=1265 RepID=A0A1M7KAV4_RUMFL|nr:MULTISPECIES: DUF3592 domain-containing protein [Ruminococcus]MCR4795570.1 DUF3592 domain-containing protein [Ruminococcus sp.]SHM62113.1 Protein of unknown function [Ruminococcus flavefaciens]